MMDGKINNRWNRSGISVNTKSSRSGYSNRNNTISYDYGKISNAYYC